jgi:hypothetical protein
MRSKLFQQIECFTVSWAVLQSTVQMLLGDEKFLLLSDVILESSHNSCRELWWRYWGSFTSTERVGVVALYVVKAAIVGTLWFGFTAVISIITNCETYSSQTVLVSLHSCRYLLRYPLDTLLPRVIGYHQN